MISIKQIKTAETYPLRIEILRNNIPENYHFIGDDNKKAIHLGAFINNRIVGIVSLMQNTHTEFTDEFVYQLRGMAIKEEMQKQGIGKKLILESLKLLKRKGCTILWCNAREVAIKFYLNLGFIIKGNSFEIKDIGIHFMMYKKANNPNIREHT